MPSAKIQWLWARAQFTASGLCLPPYEGSYLEGSRAACSSRPWCTTQIVSACCIKEKSWFTRTSHVLGYKIEKQGRRKRSDTCSHAISAFWNENKDFPNAMSSKIHEKLRLRHYKILEANIRRKKCFPKLPSKVGANGGGSQLLETLCAEKHKANSAFKSVDKVLCWVLLSVCVCNRAYCL